MLPLIWVTATVFLGAVIMLITLGLLKNRETQRLACLRGEIEKLAARKRLRADEADKQLIESCLRKEMDISEAVLAWQRTVTSGDGLVRLDGHPWDWDAPELSAWVEREVDAGKVDIQARTGRGQTIAMAFVLIGGALVAIAGYLYLSTIYVGS